jgi:hypothetical protein
MSIEAKLSPVIVTDMPPLFGMLDWLMYEVTGASKEKTALLVPMTDEIVTATSLVFLPLMSPRHETVEADDHDVVAQVAIVLSMVAVGV